MSFYTSDELAKHLNVTVGMLWLWQDTSDGPNFTEIHGRRVYLSEDVDAWALTKGIPLAS